MKRLIFTLALFLFVVPAFSEDLKCLIEIPYFNKGDKVADLYKSDKIDTDKLYADDGVLEYFPDNLTINGIPVESISYSIDNNRIIGSMIVCDNVSKYDMMLTVNMYASHNDMLLMGVYYDEDMFRLSYKSTEGSIDFFFMERSIDNHLFTIVCQPM